MKLEAHSAVPRKKYPVPQTTAQEIGWDYDLLEQKQTWCYKKHSCKETSYAESYVTMAGKSPYASIKKDKEAK